MGSRSKSGGSSKGYNPVQRIGQSQATNALNGVMDKQAGFMGQVLGPLIAQGEQAMANNPGLTNFMDKVGQKKEGMDNFFTGPDSMLARLDKVFGVEREGATPVEQAPPVNGMTDEQMAQLQRSGFGNFNINQPYNINNDMRNRFNR